MDAAELAERFGTPVIVYDRATFEARARSYSTNVDPSHIYYAAKAFCSVAMCELVASLGLSIDVCSGGELATALAVLHEHGRQEEAQSAKAIRKRGEAEQAAQKQAEYDRDPAAYIRDRYLRWVANRRGIP